MLSSPKRVSTSRDVPLWVITFGDTMALLLTFFILLQMFSELRKDNEYQRVVTAIQDAFGYAGTIGVLPVDDASLNSMIENLDRVAERHDQAHDEGASRADAPGMAGSRMRVRSIPAGMVFTLGGATGFGPLSADVSDAGRDEIARLARLLAGRRNVIEIVGHASIKSLPDRSVWASLDQLSFQRAANVREVLVAEGLDDEVFRIQASGTREPIQPRAANAQEAAANRRVEIILTDRVVDDERFTEASSARGV